MESLGSVTRHPNDVLVVELPALQHGSETGHSGLLNRLADHVAMNLGENGVAVFLGDPSSLVQLHGLLAEKMRYQLWIALKRSTPVVHDVLDRLPSEHFGALVLSKYKASLRHTKMRVVYEFCRACERTTKDYGGKKHTYHEIGTLISDVWTDIVVDQNGDLFELERRFADLFGLPPYQELRVLDCRAIQQLREVAELYGPLRLFPNEFEGVVQSRLVHGDCLEELAKLPDNSVDFAFADPPYNLQKKYIGYQDDRQISDYFLWCDKWLSELARVLKPGRTCAVLNIPIWSIRHFQHLERVLLFQNWIAWNALSFPVRMIMPAHYTVLCFAKGQPRPLPGLVRMCNEATSERDVLEAEALEALAPGFCLRSSCLKLRRSAGVQDRQPLTDLWNDIHRVKHNSRRVDHPCLLPPQLMYRLISLFTERNEVVLDCFNGAGTTTLSAAQLGRSYIGIEVAERYHSLAQQRHAELEMGMDPFRKQERALSAKNSRVPRMPKQDYVIPKKTLQLEVKRIAEFLGRIPNREDVERLARYPIAYYDTYFASWGEVCAAARNGGMSETRKKSVDLSMPQAQLAFGEMLNP